MSTKIPHKKISVSKIIYEKLTNDKNEFQKEIGIKFTYSSTINELYKILEDYKNGRR